MIKKAIISLILSATACISCSRGLIDNPRSFLSFLTTHDDLSVVSIAPSDGSIDVPITTSIQAVFTKDVSFSSINSETFIVADDLSIPVPGTFSYDSASKTVTFTPLSELLKLTHYNVLITTDVTGANGSRMADEKIWGFTTISSGTVSPGLTVISANPADGTIDVPITTSIKAIFSTEISFPSITSKTFVVADEAYLPVPGTYSYDAASKTVTFTPAAVLMYVSEYNVLITAGVTDLSGNSLVEEKIWFFHTISNGTVPAPTFNPAAGTYEGTQSIVIACADPAAAIRYTLDGTTPSNIAGTLYTAPITVSENSVFPIKAIAYRSGYTDSSITAAGYSIQAMTPTIVPPAGTYSSDQLLTLSTSTPGAVIYYTLNGLNPTPLDFNYTSTGPFTIMADTTVKAIAVKSLMTDSPMLTAVYDINASQVAPPVFSPPAGTYTSAQTVTISTPTSGSVIRFTTDGTIPTSSYGTIGTTVTVADTIILQAIAYDPAFVLADSPVTTGTYIIAPRITAVVPSKGPNTAPVVVTIKGSYFKTGATTRLALVGYPDIVGSSVTVVDSSTITCTFDITGAFLTKWDLAVINTDGGSSTNVKYFRIY